MWRFILRTLASMAGLLLLISILTFYVSRLVPGDEIMDYLTIDDRGYSSNTDPYTLRKSYQRVAHNRGLDLPAFYFSIRSGKYPDSLFQILPKQDQSNVRSWINTQHDPNSSLALYNTLFSLLEKTCTQPGQEQLCRTVHQGMSEQNIVNVRQEITKALQLPSATDHNSELQYALSLSEKKGESKFQIPHVRWNGIRNQYHLWISKLIDRSPLTSLIDGRNAWVKIGEALKWTLWLNILTLLVAIAAGTAIGLWSAKNDGKTKEGITSIFLFILFALPGFWVATLLVSFFASGDWFTWFPSGGVGKGNAKGFADSLTQSIPYMILPVVSLSAGALAYISRQMKASVRHQLTQPYVSYLRTHGLPENVIMKKHVVRNSLFPMITLFGYSLAGLFSGSLIMEVIFSIPGMGRLLYTSLIAKDWPVVFPVILITAAMTIIAFKVTDLIYAWADPRLKTETN